MNTTNIKHQIAKNHNGWLYNNIESIIRNNVDNPQLNVEFLIEKSPFNRNTFFQEFKSFTNLTPNLYIRKVKLDIAKSHLENRKYATLKDVANSVGFRRADYFSKLFFHEFGKRPMIFLTS